MDEGKVGGSSRRAASIAILVVTLAAIGLGAIAILPRQSDPAAAGIATLKDLSIAYARVQPGLTRASQLTGLGFDASLPNAHVLSYLGVMERYVTGDSTKFDSLDAALQNCVEARDRCTALVFEPADQVGSHGGGLFAALGFGSATAAPRAAEVTLLVQDGRVAYKMITGLPQASAARHHAAPVPPRSAAITPVAYRSMY